MGETKTVPEDVCARGRHRNPRYAHGSGALCRNQLCSALTFFFFVMMLRHLQRMNVSANSSGDYGAGAARAKKDAGPAFGP